MSTIQDKQTLKIKLEPAPVNVSESFPEGMIFKKAEIGYKFDRENKQLTDEKESIQLTCTDKATLEDFKVKLPLETSKQVESLQPFSDVEFINMTGTRVQFNTYLKAESVKAVKND